MIIIQEGGALSDHRKTFVRKEAVCRFIATFGKKMPEKIYEDPEIGAVRLRKDARSRRLRIRVHPSRGVTVSMPRIVPYAVGLRFFLARRDWVLETMARQREQAGPAIPAAVSRAEIERLRQLAKESLPPRLAELAQRYGFEYAGVRIKHNASNWGSCSVRKNINLNLNLVRLPRYLSDYVMLHELCHLRHANHGPEFHALHEGLCVRHLALLAEEGEPVPEPTPAGASCERRLAAELRRWRTL